MKTSTIIWTIVTGMALAFLTWRAISYQAGVVYVQDVEMKNTRGELVAVKAKQIVREQAATLENAHVSWPRTAGIWISAALTIALFSFLYQDNVFYKVAEAIFVGSSAAYFMVVAFWTALMDLLVAPLGPEFARESFKPGLKPEVTSDYLLLVPLTMGLMLLWRLMPFGGWISRWPLAFFIAVYAGIRLVGHFQADFIAQLENSLLPLIVFSADDSFDLKTSLWNFTMVFGTLACLTYFFFSVEHTGFVGGVSRVGIYLLMITFGVGFALTVMSRYSLLIGRMSFLLKEWLHLGGAI